MALCSVGGSTGATLPLPYFVNVVEIAGSNPARGMDVCLRFSVLCCPVCR
jgi:hypothetical protein